MSEWMQRIVESKRAVRREAAAMPFAEKVKIVEQLRDATEQLRAVRLVKSAKPVRVSR